MSGDETKPILCGRCNVEIQQRTDPDGQDRAFCPTCGQSDTVDNAIREAGDYLANKLARESFEGLSGSQFAKVTIAKPPERSFRFIIE